MEQIIGGLQLLLAIFIIFNPSLSSSNFAPHCWSMKFYKPIILKHYLQEANLRSNTRTNFFSSGYDNNYLIYKLFQIII